MSTLGLVDPDTIPYFGVHKPKIELLSKNDVSITYYTKRVRHDVNPSRKG